MKSGMSQFQILPAAIFASQPCVSLHNFRQKFSTSTSLNVQKATIFTGVRDKLTANVKILGYPISGACWDSKKKI